MKAWKLTGVNGESITLHEPDAQLMKVGSFRSADAGFFLTNEQLDQIRREAFDAVKYQTREYLTGAGDSTCDDLYYDYEAFKKQTEHKL